MIISLQLGFLLAGEKVLQSDGEFVVRVLCNVSTKKGSATVSYDVRLVTIEEPIWSYIEPYIEPYTSHSPSI